MKKVTYFCRIRFCLLSRGENNYKFELYIYVLTYMYIHTLYAQVYTHFKFIIEI